ncbi:hypothetical protein MRX96_054342 [Rhipicephalus microplus]
MRIRIQSKQAGDHRRRALRSAPPPPFSSILLSLLQTPCATLHSSTTLPLYPPLLAADAVRYAPVQSRPRAVRPKPPKEC